MACSCERPAPSTPHQLLSLFFPFFSLFLSFSLSLLQACWWSGAIVFPPICIVGMPVSFSRQCCFLVSRARGRFSLTGTRYPLYRRGADPAKFERGCQMLAANVEQLLFCRGVHSDASVRLSRRNGLRHGGGSSTPGSPSSGGDAGGAGGPQVLGALDKPVNGAEILKNLEALFRAEICPQLAWNFF
jgi:hypothetical protein